MELTRFGHSCVRLRKDTGSLVIDPGGLSDPVAMDGADAVLVTHEHFDHFSEERLRTAADENPALEIWTNGSVAGHLDGLGARVHVVGDGERFQAAGFEVTVHGTWHAEIHRDIPRVANVGFFVDDRVFHPGDALTVPDRKVATLLLPVHAPWSRTGELIDWLREVKPEQAYAVHDRALNEFGNKLLSGLLGDSGPGTGTTLSSLSAGDTVQLS